MDIGEGRDIDDMKEEIEFDQIFPPGVHLRLSSSSATSR